MPDLVVTFNENATHNEPKELVGRTVEDTLNALLEEEADDLTKADRYKRTAVGEPIGPVTTNGNLRPFRPGNAQDTQIEGHEVHDSRHRSLQEARGVRRGSRDRDIPGSRLHKARRGCVRDPLGLECAGGHGIQSQRAGL